MRRFIVVFYIRPWLHWELIKDRGCVLCATVKCLPMRWTCRNLRQNPVFIWLGPNFPKRLNRCLNFLCSDIAFSFCLPCYFTPCSNSVSLTSKIVAKKLLALSRFTHDLPEALSLPFKKREKEKDTKNSVMCVNSNDCERVRSIRSSSAICIFCK